ncbi:MAG TPA: TonB-dependent receptor [Rhodanobacteraceae bacterium]
MQIKSSSLSLAVAAVLGVSLMGGTRADAHPVASATSSLQTANGQTTEAAATSKKKPKTLQTVVVTGSLIRRTALETASPVVPVSRHDIENTGNLTLGNVLQQLPNIAGNATNTHNNTNNGGVANPATEGGDGASRVSLRGLGTGRTLMLIDGQRLINPDLNMIPQSLIERIDVLSEGASTTYGSDAIGGVVNLIMRRDFNGAEIQLSDGISSHGDSQRHGFTLTMGHSGNKYSLEGGIDYNTFSPTQATRRNFSKEQLYLSNGQVIPTGSGTIPSGKIQLPANLESRFGCPYVTLERGNGTSLSDYRCYIQNVDSFNYAAFNYLQTQQRRADGFVVGTYNLTDNITAFADVFYNHTTSAGLDAAAPTGTGDGYNIPASAPFNPFGVTFSQNEIPGEPNSGYSFGTRFTGAGTRLHPYTTSTGQLIAGLKGAIGQSSWLWNATIDYGHTARAQDDHNELLIGGIQDAIDDGANIFNQENDLGQLAQGVVDPVYRKFQSLKQLQITANGHLWTLAAGPMSLAVGALYRQQTMNYTVPAIAVLNTTTLNCGILGEGCSSPGRGSDNAKAVFGETLIPLLSKVPGAYSLNIDLGVRASRYNSVSATNTSKKIAIEWRPIAGLLARGTISQVFRAPTLDMLYDGPFLAQPNFNDPCVGLSAAQLAQHAAACRFVPPGFTGVNERQIDALNVGSRVAGVELKPEQGKSVDLGLVYSPGWAHGMNASLDFWHVYLHDTLVPMAATTVVNSCFENNDSPFCALITRRGTDTRDPGDVFSIDAPTTNLGQLSTSGIDFTYNYRIPHFDVAGVNPGNFKFGLLTSYVATFKNDAIPGTSNTIDYAGKWSLQFGNIARWRATITLNWNRGNWDAQWQTRYISSETALNADAATDASLPIASVVYNALQLGYAVSYLHTRFDVGVDNLFNRRPPLFYQNGQMNTDTLTYDVLGRYYWARATLKF